MTPKEKGYFLLTEYKAGRYNTYTFCDEFTYLYDFELYNDTTLNGTEQELFRELSIITSRFSPFEEDLKIPNAFFDEKDVRSKVNEVYEKLLRND